MAPIESQNHRLVPARPSEMFERLEIGNALVSQDNDYLGSPVDRLLACVLGLPRL